MYRPEAGIEVEHLAQRHVQRANAAADWGGQRAFDADKVFLEGFHGIVRQPMVELLEGNFTREDLEPGNLAPARVGLLHCGIEHALAGGPDVRPGAVTADEGEDRLFGNAELAAGDGGFAPGRRREVLV